MDTLTPLLALLGNNPYLQATTAMLLAIISASFLAYILSRLISGLIKVSGGRISETVGYTVRSPLYWTVLGLGALTAVRLLPLSQKAAGIAGSVIFSLLLVSWSTFAIRVTRGILLHLSRVRGKRQLIHSQTLPLFNNIALVVVLAIAGYLFFVIWNIDMTAWLASAGIVGIAVGFAAKDTLANLFAGVFILADAPYKIGDYIVLDNNQRGKVTNIGLRSTRILTREDVEVTVPNSIIGNSSIINESGGPHVKHRIRVPVGVAYGSDIDLVRNVLERIADDEAEVCADPEPRVRFRQFGNSALEFELLSWVEEPEIRGRVVDALNCQIYHQFRDHGIEIPYSKHDIHVKSWPTQDEGPG
ncbi:mechanosensitive ion channel family protein [Seongchinamella unica]|uniref:Small-conductance mechanosensitive channel n=1 Tax=Seongchinamella unica TaxID=2547392 RepID=A0A4R5LNB5_9GAMM|nr:mechanosensitive ion channel family protein [Seongchinamella unica]TDG11832.1 mechanosensitive ion channel family protein [Seongchinamella unica]